MNRYDDIARQALDVLQEFGECRVIRVASIEELRRAVRAEARRRKQQITTHADRSQADRLWIYTERPTIEAQAYQVVSSSTIPDVMDRVMARALDPSLDDSEPLIDSSVRVVDADWL